MADPSPPAPPPLDWEVLSLSMSASAFGSAPDACTGLDSGNGESSVVLPLSDRGSASEASLPAAVNQDSFGHASIEENPVQLDEADESGKISTGIGASGSGLLSRNCQELFSDGSRSDITADDGKIGVVRTSELDPFTEGWKPLIGTAGVGDQDHGSFDNCQETVDGENNFFQGDYEEGTCTASEVTEPLVGFQKEMFMASEEFVLREGTARENILPGSNLRDDEVSRKKSCKAQANAIWWKARSQKSSAIWTIALAATVVGIVIIGHRWQQERCQNQQLRLELSAKNEKLDDLLNQVNRLKEVVTGRRVRGSSF